MFNSVEAKSFIANLMKDGYDLDTICAGITDALNEVKTEFDQKAKEDQKKINAYDDMVGAIKNFLVVIGMEDDIVGELNDMDVAEKLKHIEEMADSFKSFKAFIDMFDGLSSVFKGGDIGLDKNPPQAKIFESKDKPQMKVNIKVTDCDETNKNKSTIEYKKPTAKTKVNPEDWTDEDISAIFGDFFKSIMPN